MKHLKLKTLAATVLTACTAIGGTAQADSVFLPLIASDIANGFLTVVSLKARGNGNTDVGSAAMLADVTPLKYTYLKKGSNPAELLGNNECVHDNGSGDISSWDMLTHTVDPLFDFVAKSAVDNSTPYTPAGIAFGQSFYGMAVIDDVANLNSANEGNLSGEVNVFNIFTGTLLDYKMLNNHRSTATGDFSTGFTRKSSVDLSWNPTDRDFTFWLGVATGPLMTNDPAFYSDSFRISQQTRPGNSSPQAPFNGPGNVSGGVYDNDENVYSGDTPLDVTCMRIFSRADFLNGSQEAFTRDGGWTRKSIISTGANASANRGGLVYKAAVKLLSPAVGGNFHASFQVETSGHLGAGNEHPNRPY